MKFPLTTPALPFYCSSALVQSELRQNPSHAMKEHRPMTARQAALAERALFDAILTLQSVAECRAFFNDLCTPAELQAMTDRWAVVGLLKSGLPYREIYKQTGVSLTTISRVARCLMAGDGGYASVSERVHHKPKAHA